MSRYQCPRCDTPHTSPGQCPECGPGPQVLLCPTHGTGFNPGCHRCEVLVAAQYDIR